MLANAMYEGKNIHYSQADQRPLCSFSGKICRQRRLNGYALCLRHILEDPTAPYKRCEHIAKNGQQCSNIIPQSRNTDFCNSHMQVHTLASVQFQSPPSAGLALQSLAKSQQISNGLLEGTASHGCKTEPVAPGKIDSQPVSKTKLDKAISDSSGLTLDDPYAFPSDPEPLKVESPSASYSSMAHPFPNLSQALANLASGSRHGHLPSSEPRSEGSSSIARLFPELADKLDIGKNSKVKTDPPKAKSFFPSSLGDSHSSRTMNRLQTKIAQNKIKDKLRKNSITSSRNSHSNSSLNSVKPSQMYSSVTGRKASTGSLSLGHGSPSNAAFGIEAKRKSLTGKKSHISASVSNHRIANKSRTSKVQSKISDSSSLKNEGSGVAGVQVSGVNNSLNCAVTGPWANMGGSHLENTMTGLQTVAPLFPPTCITVSGVTPEKNTELLLTSLCSITSPVMCATTYTTCSDVTRGIVSTTSLVGVPSSLEKLPSDTPSKISACDALARLASPGDVSKAHHTRQVNSVPHSLNIQVQGADAAKDDSGTTGRLSGQETHHALMASSKSEPPSMDAKCHKPRVSDVRMTEANVSLTFPPCMKVRQTKESATIALLRQRLKRHSAVNVCLLHQKRKWNNINLCPMGVDSSEEDESDVDEALPYQHEWLLSSDSEREDESSNDDPLLADIRHTKQRLLHAKLRRCFVQVQKAYHGNTCLHSAHMRALSVLLTSARADPRTAAEALKITLHESDPPAIRTAKQGLFGCRPCLCKTDGENLCNGTALPFTNQCGKHIMYNVDQQPYDYCTAKFSDNTQCCVPVFDIKHELPLCPEHAAKAENYQKNLEACRPKKPRKKTKPSALTRPPKKGKKKKNQRKNSKVQREMSPVLMNSNSNSVLPTDDLSADDNADLTSDLRPPSSPESKVTIGADLGSELEESFSPGIIDKHLELPLGEHDLNEVLNKLPDDAFELFTGKNGDFSVNSKVEEEAAVFEHVLAETSKKLKASESLSQVGSDNGHGMTMMIGDNDNIISNHNSLVDEQSNMISEHGNEDDLTKEIADSILQQNLSPTGSMVDDLGQDNISALASSLSVNDLRNISQVLNATLINPAPELPNPAYSDTSNSDSIQGQGQCLDSLNPSSVENHASSYPYMSAAMPQSMELRSSCCDLPHEGSSTGGGGQEFISPVPTQTVGHEGTTLGQQVVPVSSASSTQSIAQILAALTASTKQFTNTCGQNSVHVGSSGQQFSPATSIDNLLQVPAEGRLDASSPANSIPTAHSATCSTTAGLMLANQYASSSTSQNMTIPQQQMSKHTSTSLHNGLYSVPTSTHLALPVVGTGTPFGLKLSCPVQTLLPLSLLENSLPQGLANSAVPASAAMLASQGQPLVAMTSPSHILTHPAAQSNATTTNV